jgi:coatomer subunit beta'
MVISSYSLPLTVIEYQTAVIRGDLDAAAALLPNIESGHYNKIARFLEAQGQLAAALQLTQDLEHKFELGLQLEQLEVCHQVALTLDQDYKWKALADHALKKWNVKCANVVSSSDRMLETCQRP